MSEAFPFIDAPLSHLFESTEWLPSLALVDQLQREQPMLGAERHQVAGGWAVYAGPNSPLSHAIGMGLHGPVTAADLDRVEALYQGRQSFCEVVVSPYADMSLVQLLGQRGYAITEWNSVLVRVLVDLPPLDAPGIEIRRVSSADARLWAETIASGFADIVQVPADLFIPFATAPEAICYLAYIDGQPVGGAGGSAFPAEGVASIYGASTVLAYRGRGVQNALLRARIRAAAELRCKYAVISTMPGTVSQHNAERNGFRVAYTKCSMQRRF